MVKTTIPPAAYRQNWSGGDFQLVYNLLQYSVNRFIKRGLIVHFLWETSISPVVSQSISTNVRTRPGKGRDMENEKD